MALAPQFATHRIAGRATAAHVLELYLDIICPFSRKQLQGVREHVLPVAEANPEALTVIIRQVRSPRPRRRQRPLLDTLTNPRSPSAADYRRRSRKHGTLRRRWSTKLPSAFRAP